jgi:hypothetical protein
MGRRVVGCIATAALVFSFAELTTVPVGAQTTGSRPTASNAASQASGSGLQASQRQKSEARSPKPYVPPRTPWGDPDIAGVFTNNDESLTPFERPAQFEGRRLEDITPAELEQLRDQRSDQREEADRNRAEFRSPIHWFENFFPQNSRAWLVTDPPDGKVPPQTDEARQRASSRALARAGRGPADSYEDRSLYDRCISRGLPGSMMPAIYGNAYEIHQGPGYVAIRYEMVNETRIIPLDGRPHVNANIPFYMGDARGHWDGNTLVVETTNFNPRTAYRGASEHLKLVERFKPLAPNVLEWSSTFEDPHTWTRPWTFAMNLTKKDASQRPFEYACHEGNYGMVGILLAGRADDKAAEEAARKGVAFTPRPGGAEEER